MNMSAEWNKRNPEKMRAAHKRWLLKHPEHSAQWLASYKLTNAAMMRETKRRWNAANKARIDAQRAERKLKNTRQILSADLKFKFGITLEQYEEMSLSQDNACAICRIPAAELTKRMGVDHNHATEKVRGLLCNHCNTGLGFFKENKTTLTNAINYLNEHSNCTSKA